MEPPDLERASTAGSWLARTTGAILLVEQAAAHLWHLHTSMVIVGIGLFLLAGKEGAEFVLAFIGREPPGGGSAGGSSSGPP